MTGTIRDASSPEARSRRGGSLTTLAREAQRKHRSRKNLFLLNEVGKASDQRVRLPSAGPQSPAAVHRRSLTDGTLLLGQAETSRHLVPKGLELGERKLLAVLRKVVLHIDDETLLLAAVQRPSKTTSDHLLIQIRAVRRPGNIDRPHGRSIEPLGEYAVIRQYPNFPWRGTARCNAGAPRGSSPTPPTQECLRATTAQPRARRAQPTLRTATRLHPQAGQRSGRESPDCAQHQLRFVPTPRESMRRVRLRCSSSLGVSSTFEPDKTT